MKKDRYIGLVGLGYVGLPLLIELSKEYKTIGFDINIELVNELSKGIDTKNELNDNELKLLKKLDFTHDINDLRDCNFYIVTVPTPIDSFNEPDLGPLTQASEMIGTILSENNIVVYESTVYPGVTEEHCGNILQKKSNLKLNENFYIGYSPERINPGDKKRKLRDIPKLISASNESSLDEIDIIYSSVVDAGTFRTSSIKIAESAKVIENIQRDVNIALINELHQVFTRIEINTIEVIEAASTKWNFMKLNPGLVGGHCIGVDPYYLFYA